MLHLLSHEEANVTIEQQKDNQWPPITCSLPIQREERVFFNFLMKSMHRIPPSQHSLIFCSNYFIWLFFLGFLFTRWVAWRPDMPTDNSYKPSDKSTNFLAIIEQHTSKLAWLSSIICAQIMKVFNGAHENRRFSEQQEVIHRPR